MTARSHTCELCDFVDGIGGHCIITPCPGGAHLCECGHDHDYGATAACFAGGGFACGCLTYRPASPQTPPHTEGE